MKDYDPKVKISFLSYLDANNLYGWAMMHALPMKDFKWVLPENYEAWRDYPCVLDVDVEYPAGLHDAHNELPFLPESLEVNKVKKLIPNLYDKKNYIIHRLALQQAIENGLILKKINRVITFTELPWMGPYIELNTKLRTKHAKCSFRKNFYKLMNNSVFGKTMENVRNRVDIRLVSNEARIEKLSKKCNFESVNVLTPCLAAVHMKRLKVELNKPIYVGQAILDISKTLMYDFHYNYIKKLPVKSTLCYTDTDSFIYWFFTENISKYISGEWFDFSDYPVAHPLYSIENKKVLGKFKDECNGEIMTEFIALRSKLYSFVMENNEEKKRCKGVSEAATLQKIKHENYRECVNGSGDMTVAMTTFISNQHDVETISIQKIALSANDDKRLIQDDKHTTKAYGHHRLE